MKARIYKVELTGVTPLLMHNDNLEWAGAMQEWAKDPANKKGSTAGDDRSPAFRWIGNLYTDRGLVVLPSDNIMTMLREGGAKCPTGKRQGTFKSLTQSGLCVNEVAWPIIVGGKTISTKAIETLKTEEDYSVHEATIAGTGFVLFAKRARIGMAKHVRVRPRFDEWTAAGTITALDDMITTDVLQNILTVAGALAGLCDWRPSSQKSGPYGRFTATVKEVK